MDDDSILDLAAETDFYADPDIDYDDLDTPETDDYSFDDEDLLAYRADRQAEYDDEWGDPLDMPSYGTY